LLSYGAAIMRRIKGGAEMHGSGDSQEDTLDLFGDVLKDLTAASFLRACIEENDRYMASFDPRLLRPRVIPTMAKIALGLVETIDRIRAAFPKSAPRSSS
jgi:hypothetical protein